MRNIEVILSDTKVSIFGNKDFLDNPIISNWLEYSFEDFTEIGDGCIIKHQSFEDKNFLYQFKIALEKKFSSYNIIFSKNLLHLVEDKIQESKNFEEFSKQAEDIWKNIYDINHFNEFCLSLEKNLVSRRLYEHQLKCAYHLAFSQNGCNFSVPGSGKTSIVYGAYAYLSNTQDESKKLNKMLIIGPYSSFDPWEEEYKECFGVKPKIFRLSDEKSRKKKKSILKGREGDYDIIIMTYNSVPNLIDELKIFLKSNNVMFVCDEAHKIKNAEGIWANSVLKIASLAKSRVILTGTPCPNGYEDLYNLFKFLYPDKNIIQYNYSHLKSMTEKVIASDIDLLKSNIKPFFVRIKKEDLNLPEITDHGLLASEMSDLESLIYEKIQDRLVNDKKHTFSLLHRLMQSCNNLHLLNKPLEDEYLLGAEYDDSLDLKKVLGSEITEELQNLNGYVPSKFNVILDLANELKNDGKKILLWGRYIDSIKRLSTFLQKNGFCGDFIVGETSTKGGTESERSKIVNQFKNNKSYDFLISSPMVLGESVSLHRSCHHAIYFEMDYNAAPYFQSRDRIHRVWLDENNNQRDYETNYYNIVSRLNSNISTVDDKIFNNVNKKLKRMLNIINDDIPLFSYNLDNERDLLIKEIIDDYQS